MIYIIKERKKQAEIPYCTQCLQINLAQLGVTQGILAEAGLLVLYGKLSIPLIKFVINDI